MCVFPVAVVDEVLIHKAVFSSLVDPFLRVRSDVSDREFRPVIAIKYNTDRLAVPALYQEKISITFLWLQH